MDFLIPYIPPVGAILTALFILALQAYFYLKGYDAGMEAGRLRGWNEAFAANTPRLEVGRPYKPWSYEGHPIEGKNHEGQTVHSVSANGSSRT